jgi:hypothetical protein
MAMNDPRNRLSRFSFGDTGAPERQADYGKPVLGVHVLTEFVYCRCAGLVAYESKGEDIGEEPRGRPLDYSPMYHYRDICLQYIRVMDRLVQWVLVGIAILIATVVCTLLISRWFLLSGTLGAAIFTGASVRLIILAIPLVHRRKAADRAKERRPDADSPEDEIVGWWELRKAGFAATNYQDTLSELQLGIRGKPQIVLRYADMVIPVFFCNKDPGKTQHRVRIAAYCHLIERRERARSPFGVVVEKGTYAAHVIKNTRRHRDMLHRALRSARQTIREAEDVGLSRMRPEATAKCKKCPIGEPRRYLPGITQLVGEGRVVPIYPVDCVYRRSVFHSHCGDLMEWLPPHECVVELGLRDARSAE